MEMRKILNNTLQMQTGMIIIQLHFDGALPKKSTTLLTLLPVARFGGPFFYPPEWPRHVVSFCTYITAR
ncbi:hypothetical protein DSJ_14365 [Pantoea stewartii subsp. stewartii DC283]|uniref:Uncharacterized protein n=1 Tax=Pantoea stewartii subsp. stewartii DC283 TaxID=660596 RepID=A0ABM6K7A1_PANSE|nr:hypothetical protein DSJ_14365 [Pantoea stewartii subsp. stewartii DC283]